MSPLADHVDLREHYIAFIDLKNFGISEADLEQVVTDGVSVKALKDVVQLALIQQSEYLRRFSLTFSEKVREDHDLNKAGVLKQVRDLVGSLRKINTKLTSVFDYHQAMGIVPEHKQKSLMASRSRQMDLVPLRTVYTSLFSTGLHLQNSLLKVRQLESIFDKIEKSKTKETDMVSALIPNEEHLVEWLTGFKTIQTELNACVGCLDDGLAQIDLLNGTEEESHNKSKTSSRSATPIEHKIVGGKENIPKIDDDTPQEHLDEVFEAVITHDAGAQSREESSEVDGLSKEERKKRLREKKQSEKLLTELKSVLVVKAISMEEREAHALARKNKIASPIAANSIDEQLCKEELKEVDEIVVEQIKEVVKPAASLLEGSTSESAALVKKDGVEKTCLAEPSIGTFVTSSDSPQKHSPGKNSQSTDESSKDKNGGLGYNGVPNPKEKIPLKVEKKTKDIPKPVISENGRQSKVINSDDSKRIVTEPLQPKSPSNHKIEICATKEENYVGKKMINLNSSLSDSKVAANNSSSKNDLEISKENGNSKEGGITNNLDPFLCAPNDAQNLSSNSNQDANGSKGTFEDAFVLPSDDKEEEELSFDNLKTALSLPHLPEENKKGNPGNGFPETSHLTPLSDNSSSDSNSSLVSSSESSSSDQATVKSVVGSKENMLEESRVMSKSVPRSKSGSELKSGRSFSEEEDSSSYANDDDDSSSPEEDLETEEVKKRKAATLTKLNKDIGRGDYFRSTSVPNTVTNLRAAPSVGSLPSPPKARGNLTSEHCCSLSELRSISSPDIKRLVGEDESTSPYVSLENLKRRRKPLGPRNSSGTNHTESDSECGSADEMQHQVLKTYQRPLRPAAIKKEMKREKSGLPSEKKSGVSSSAAQSRKRRDRNRTRSITSADLAEAALTQKKADSPPSEGVRSNGDGVCSPKRAPANTYVDKKEREGSSIFLPMGRPLGFESSIARQAAARAANGLNGLLKPAKEEIFGASDSD